MIVYINLLMVFAISLVCLGLAKIIYESARINRRIDNLFANQRKMYKYQLFSLLVNMRNLRALAIIQEEYEIVNSLQESIEKVEKILKDYEKDNP